MKQIKGQVGLKQSGALLIHFEFIFVYGVRECSNFILLQIVVQFSQHHLLKMLSFLDYICYRLGAIPVWVYLWV